MLKLLKNRNYIFFFIASHISQFGDIIDDIVLLLFLNSKFPSAFNLSLFFILNSLPKIIFGSIGGRIVDKYNRKVLLTIGNITNTILVLSLIFYSNYYYILFIIIIMSTISTIIGPLENTILQDILKDHEYNSAVSLSVITTSLIEVIAPGLAGIIVFALSYKVIFIIDGFTYLICLLIIIELVKFSSFTNTGNNVKNKNTPTTDKFNLINNYKQFFNELKKDSNLKYLFFYGIITVFFLSPYNLMITNYVLNVINVNSQNYGLYNSLIAIVAIVSSYAQPYLNKKFNKVNLLFFPLQLTAFFSLLFIINPNRDIMFFLYSISGIAAISQITYGELSLRITKGKSCRALIRGSNNSIRTFIRVILWFIFGIILKPENNTLLLFIVSIIFLIISFILMVLKTFENLNKQEKQFEDSGT